MKQYIVKKEEAGKRIDAYICNVKNEISRTAVQRLIEEQAITVNGKNTKRAYKVQENDVIEIEETKPKEIELKAENIPLEIIYEDEDIIVVNKPKGLVVHPAVGNPDGTLVNAIMAICKETLSGIGGEIRPGIVHRLDKDTSGILIIAKNDSAHNFLAEQIKEHSFTREYEAVVHGNIKADNGSIDAPIGRHPVKRKQMAVTPENSKNAVTHFTVLQRFGDFTHVRLRLETGRTHQIRVHMSYIGHPVAGDEVYGPKSVAKGLSGQCLHAKKIGFIHPATREYLEFDSELPRYFNSFLEKMK